MAYRYNEKRDASGKFASVKRKGGFVCKTCGKDFSDFTSRNRQYCSKKCWYDSKKFRQHISARRGPTLKRTCRHCGKVEYVSPSEKKRIYCSQLCYAKASIGKVISESARKKISEANKGEKNHSWKGGYRRKIYNNRRYRARRMGAEGSHTLEEWEEKKKEFNHTCLMCGKAEPEITLTVDHIVPLIGGGTDYINNIQPLCKSCNSIKRDRPMEKYVQEAEILA